MVPASWLAALGEPREEREHLVQRLLRAGARARQHGAHLEVLEHRQAGKDLAAFGDLADAEVADRVRLQARRCRGRLEADLAGARLLDAGDGADERGLAGAVGADDGDDLAFAAPRGETSASACASP